MTADRRIRITVETERILFIARQHATRGWCDRCGQEVELLPEKQAGQFRNMVRDQREKRHQSRLHLGQAKDGLVICVKSMLRFLQSASGQLSS